MSELFAALVGFAVINLISVTYVSVFYHRGLSHRALEMSPALRWWVLRTGFWVTGVDPKGWTALHRMHHRHSDTELDPHHPERIDPVSIAAATALSYLDYMRRMHAGDPDLNRIAADVPWGMPPKYLLRLWFMPAVVWVGLAALVVWGTGSWGLAIGGLLGFDFIAKTWVANGLGHSHGYRNYDTDDTSTNNRWAVWLIGGENLHNNHHRYPSRANFAHRSDELDPGYAICRMFQALGLLQIKSQPPRAQQLEDLTAS